MYLALRSSKGSVVRTRLVQRIPGFDASAGPRSRTIDILPIFVSGVRLAPVQPPIGVLGHALCIFCVHIDDYELRRDVDVDVFFVWRVWCVWCL